MQNFLSQLRDSTQSIGDLRVLGVGSIVCGGGFGGEVLEVVEVGVFGSGFYGARGFCEHIGDAVFAIGDEVFDEGGFGEVFPVAFGHFGLHGLHFEAGGVEDAAVVGAPCGFEGVGLIDGVVGDAGGEDEGLGVPVGATFGGEDGPVHVGEAFAEEG